MFSMRSFLWVYCFATIWHISLEYSTSESPYYTAGVVEFASHFSSQENAHRQLDIITGRYLSIIDSPEANAVDIMVFPELTLNQVETAAVIPHQNDIVAPCNNNKYSVVVQNISCAAKRQRKYVVINLTTQHNCTKDTIDADSGALCPANERIFYNTAVAFDRSGYVISTYRKFNLFNDDNITRTARPDYSTFITDFNVTFALFICFDIVLYDPAVKLVERGIQNFIMPTMWFSVLPFSTAVQVQQMWSFAHNVNLLAAGGSIPFEGYSGSGIFSGHHGALNAVMSNVSVTKLLVAQVPKSPDTPFTNLTTFKPAKKWNFLSSNPSTILEKETIQYMQVTMLNFTQSRTQTGEVCHNDFCCQYDVEVFLHRLHANSSFYSYAIVAFDGFISYLPHSSTIIHSTICGMVACRSDTECDFKFTHTGQRSKKYSFKRLTLFAKFSSSNAVKIAPNTLTTEIFPLQKKDYIYTESKSQTPTSKSHRTRDVTLSLAYLRSDLMTFSIYARDYSQDLTSQSPRLPMLSQWSLTIVVSLAVLLAHRHSHQA